MKSVVTFMSEQGIDADFWDLRNGRNANGQAQMDPLISLRANENDDDLFYVSSLRRPGGAAINELKRDVLDVEADHEVYDWGKGYADALAVLLEEEEVEDVKIQVNKRDEEGNPASQNAVIDLGDEEFMTSESLGISTSLLTDKALSVEEELWRSVKDLSHSWMNNGFVGAPYMSEKPDYEPEAEDPYSGVRAFDYRQHVKGRNMTPYKETATLIYGSQVGPLERIYGTFVESGEDILSIPFNASQLTPRTRRRFEQMNDQNPLPGETVWEDTFSWLEFFDELAERQSRDLEAEIAYLEAGNIHVEEGFGEDGFEGRDYPHAVPQEFRLVIDGEAYEVPVAGSAALVPYVTEEVHLTKNITEQGYDRSFR